MEPPALRNFETVEHIIIMRTVWSTPSSLQLYVVTQLWARQSGAATHSFRSARAWVSQSVTFLLPLLLLYCKVYMVTRLNLLLLLFHLGDGKAFGVIFCCCWIFLHNQILIISTQSTTRTRVIFITISFVIRQKRKQQSELPTQSEGK